MQILERPRARSSTFGPSQLVTLASTSPNTDMLLRGLRAKFLGMSFES